MAKAPAKSTRSPADRRRAIQDAAVRLFYRQGYGATSMREIAAAARVQIASIYTHFPSKQDLLVQTLIEKNAEQNAVIEDALRDAGSDPAARLDAFIRARLSEFKRPVAERTIIDLEMRSVERRHRARVVALRDRQDAWLDAILADGAAAGLWPPPAPITRLLVFQATNIGVWYRADGPLSLERIAEHILAFVRHGLARPDAAARRGMLRLA
jgi:AcrR family transcriptional regulator